MTNQKKTLTEVLRDKCREVVCGFDGEIGIAPATVAAAVLKELDPKNVSVIAVQWGCNLQCRAIARDLLREKFGSFEKGAIDEDAQHELFPNLQKRYPAKRPGGPQYVLLEELTREEWRANVDRMNAAIRGQMEHVDALTTWGERHFAQVV